MARTAYSTIPERGILLHRCARCAGDLDRYGKLCRRCNKKQVTKSILASAAVLELAVAAVIAIKPLKLPSLHIEDQAALAAPPPIETAARTIPGGPTGWMYFDSSDPLIDDVTHHARLLGNAAAPSATGPNQSMATGVLELSASAHYGKQILVSFPRVRTACGANPCSVQTAFDQEAAHGVAFTDASQGQSTVLILGDYDRLTASMMHAQTLTVTASMGTEKDTVLSFDVAGLKLQLAQWVRAHPVRLVEASPAQARQAG